MLPSAAFGSLYFIYPNISAIIYQEILQHFMLGSAGKLYEDAGFHLSSSISL